MSNPKYKTNQVDMIDEVLSYLGASSGLKSHLVGDKLKIHQITDQKEYLLQVQTINEVLQRQDSEHRPFLQINFVSGVRVLLTDSLIGFKPFEIIGLEMSRIPRVVTTPDLKIVFDAIEESLGNETGVDNELEILKKVYLSILVGGEKSGFGLQNERLWLNRLLASRSRASA